MKINKSIVLTIFLIFLLAITVTSQKPQKNNSVSVEEKQDCAITFYNVTENVYGYVTRERNVYGNCLYYDNHTGCLNTSGPNTYCFPQQSVYNITCITGKESDQSYEVVSNQIVLRNKTYCRTKSYLVSINKGALTEKKELDFSSTLWDVCINSTENGCLVVTCGTLKGGSARNGIFNGCDGGKSCQKFLFCEDRIKVLYKASRDNFVEEDPTFYLPPLALKEVGR